jgi:uncharacterized protein YndB with AHSA1/START domain
VTHGLEYVVERDMPAPRNRVWAAWTDPASFAAWFGGMTATLDVSSGGRWRVDSIEEGAIGGRYLEVDEGRRLVMETEFDGGGTVMHMTFEDHGGGTRVRIRQQCRSIEERDGGREGSEVLLARCAGFLTHQGLIKRIELPAGFEMPRLLAFDDIELRAIGREHLADDVAGINVSLDLIKRTRGGSWPMEPVTEEIDFVDLVWHECEFRDRKSFTYAIYRTNGSYLGCCYFYPMGVRQPLTAELVRHDLDISWWVTPDAHDRGDYTKVRVALQSWLGSILPFDAPHFSNIEHAELTI